MGAAAEFRAVVFDLDGVVRTWDGLDVAAAEADHGLPHGSVLGTAFEVVLLERAVTGAITDEVWRATVAERLTAEHGLDGAAVVAAWSAGAGAVDLEILDLVRAVRSTRPVPLLTNATTRLASDLDRLGLAAEVDHLFNTSDLGVAKPDSAVFELVAAQLGVRPAQVLFVDDSPSSVAAAGPPACTPTCTPPRSRSRTSSDRGDCSAPDRRPLTGWPPIWQSHCHMEDRTAVEGAGRPSLRDQHRASTRERVLEALAELLSEGHTVDVAMSVVAERAEVGERTLYRHFPTKQELFGALFSWVTAGTPDLPPPTTPEGLVDRSRAFFEAYARRPEVIRAMGAHGAAEHRLARAEMRRTLVANALATATDGVEEPRRTQLLAAVHLLTSSDAFLHAHDNWSMDGEAVGDMVAWAVGVLVAGVGEQA